MTPIRGIENKKPIWDWQQDLFQICLRFVSFTLASGRPHSRFASWRGTKPSRQEVPKEQTRSVMARNEAIQIFTCSFLLDEKRTKESRAGPSASSRGERFPAVLPIPNAPCPDSFCHSRSRPFFLKHLLSNDKRQGRNISEIRTIRGQASTSGRLLQAFSRAAAGSASTLHATVSVSSLAFLHVISYYSWTCL